MIAYLKAIDSNPTLSVRAKDYSKAFVRALIRDDYKSLDRMVKVLGQTEPGMITRLAPVINDVISSSLGRMEAAKMEGKERIRIWGKYDSTEADQWESIDHDLRLA